MRLPAQTRIYWIALFAAIALVSACEQRNEAHAASAVGAPTEKAPVEKAEEAKEKGGHYTYSPFYVSLAGGGEFDIVTFKDVGLKRDSDDPTDPALEVIAESLAYGITSSELGYAPASVGYDEKLADPDNHKVCGQNHLYVDVWKTTDHRYGFSLWSGCGEIDNFAWKQLETPSKADSMTDEVQPLTDSILKTLSEAKARNCFQKHC